jgi:hypothetical protein
MQDSVTITLSKSELVRVLNAMLEVDYECEGGMSDGQRVTYNRLYNYAYDLGCQFSNGWWSIPKPAQPSYQKSDTLVSTQK